MPDVQTLFLFAAACLALAATPGPDMALIASRSAAQGRAAGFMTLAGIQAGTYVHALALALGLSQLFLIVPLAYDVVRWIGAAYLLYLAWATLAAGSSATANGGAESTSSLQALFFQGFITNILNPKMVLFMLALLPQFLVPQSGSVALQILVLATILNLIGFAVNGAVILAAGQARALMSGADGMSRLPNYLLAIVFAGLAVRLAVSSRQ